MPDSLVALGGGYAPDGWKQWPDDADFSFQFIRILAAAQEGASTIGECFLTASRIKAGDRESWFQEWTRIAQVNQARAEKAEAKGFNETAKANWLRATNYYRSAEFFLDPADPRRMETFNLIEQCSHRVLGLMTPKGEIICVSYEGDHHLDAYFLPTPEGVGARPTVIAFGGLDEYKDELVQEMAKYALPRGFSLLLVDLPGQGGTIRRQGLTARADTEVAVSACVDYLLSRSDVDASRIALYGASLGGYFSARAASFEHRLKCAVVDGAQWKLVNSALRLPEAPESAAAMHARWVFGEPDVTKLIDVADRFDLELAVDKIRCPLLIVHGTHDEWGTAQAESLFNFTQEHGVNVQMKWFTPEETGAAHCQCDNPTLGMEYICDWLGRELNCLDE